MEAPRYPLPAGHMFGPTFVGDLRFHDGRHPAETGPLRAWQTAYRARWRRPRYQPSGVYDGATQRAVAEVQAVLGVPVTGLLGATEWVAVWERDPPPGRYKAEHPRAVVDPKVAARRRKRARDYWAKYSRYEVTMGADPNAPDWYPGRPFGQHEKGPHVRRVRELLDQPPGELFTVALYWRVRGLQRALGLPVTGIVDARLAAYLDNGSAAREPG